MMPKKGDKFLWRSGYTVVVKSDDVSTSVVMTDARNKNQIPTVSLIESQIYVSCRNTHLDLNRRYIAGNGNSPAGSVALISIFFKDLNLQRKCRQKS
jgi:hypothetical protein